MSLFIFLLRSLSSDIIICVATTVFTLKLEGVELCVRQSDQVESHLGVGCPALTREGKIGDPRAQISLTVPLMPLMRLVMSVCLFCGRRRGGRVQDTTLTRQAYK